MSGKEYILDTDCNIIKQSVNGDYAIEIAQPPMAVNSADALSAGPLYLPVGRLDVDFSDAASVESALENKDISSEIKADIQHYYKEALEQGNTSIHGSIYSADLLSAASSGSAAKTNYYPYKGKTMKTDVFNITTAREEASIEKGVTAKDKAAFVVNVGLVASGSATVATAMFSSGISLYQAFVDLYGSNFASGYAENSYKVAITYSGTTQYTYGQSGSTDWLLGLATQKITINNIDWVQYYFNKQTQTGNRSCSLTQKSPHFDSPWATAYNNLTYGATEWVSCKIGNATYWFGDGQ